MSRLIAWWSAGTTSAVAAGLALRTMAHEFDEVVIAYCASIESDEHPDNARFLTDCEKWYGAKILKLYSDQYTGLEDLWEKRKYIAGNQGAPCTMFLKRIVREKFQQPGDVHVFGFDDGEHDRAADFQASNPGLILRFPLIDAGLSHGDCDALIVDAGIILPAMYLLGFLNNNCIGCIKGGLGYWNKVRKYFPEIFKRRCEFTRRLGVRLLAISVNGVRKRIFLDELPEDVGRYEAEESIECGIGCSLALATIGKMEDQ